MGSRRPAIDDISVVVPTLGRPVLAQTLRSILAGSRWPACLIIIHQGRDPGVAQLVETARASGLNAIHVPSEQRGFAPAKNRGLERVATRYFAINDDDQLVATDWLERMRQCLQRHPGVVVTGRVDGAAAGVPSTITMPVPVLHVEPLLKRDPLFSGNMGASVEVLDAVGLFDEAPALNGAEDNDWGYRALRAGVPILYAPDVAVTHLDWRDRAGLAGTYRRYARAQGGFYGKHLRHGDPFIARRALRDLARGPWLVVRAAATRNADLAMIGMAETRGILPGIVAGLRTTV